MAIIKQSDTSKYLFILWMATSIAHADQNDAAITESDAQLSSAAIEQIEVTSQPVTALISQNNTNTASSAIFQAITDDTGSLDLTSLAGQSTYAQDNGVVFDLSNDLYADSSGYNYFQLNPSNFALIKEDGTANANAMIFQLSADDVASFPAALVNGLNGSGENFLTNMAGNPIGLDGNGAVTYDYLEFDVTTFTFTSHVAQSYVPGVISGTTTENSNNIALISQGGLPVDRDGNAVGTASQQGASSDGVQAIIIQTGTSNVGVIQQAGNNTFAAILQDGTGNDAYIAQDNTDHTDSATASIVQLGADNVATIKQGSSSGDDSDWSIVQVGTNNVSEVISVGNSNKYAVIQTGTDNIAILHQGDPNDPTADFNNNAALIVQTGNANQAYLDQGYPSNGFSTNDSVAQIIQEADNDLANIIQYGQQQIAMIHQHL